MCCCKYLFLLINCSLKSIIDQQSTPNWPTLKTDCILNLLQVFVETHPNSAVVFQEVWNAQVYLHH